MAAIRGDGAVTTRPLDGWELAVTPPGAWLGPPEGGADWLPATVPGTAAAALEAAGRWRRDRPHPLHDDDVWYRVRLPAGTERLRFDGLATIAEVWLDGACVLRSDSMFLAQVADILSVIAGLDPAIPIGEVRRSSDRDGRDEPGHDSSGRWLHIAFRSLTADLAGRTGKRARWRTAMIVEPKLRLVRTTALGHMPGWCPPVDIVGPWRPVVAETGSAPPQVALRTALDGAVGRLTVHVADEGSRIDGGSVAHLPHAEVAGGAGPRSTHAGGASFEAPLRGAPQDEGRGRRALVLHCAGMSIPLAPHPGGGWSGTLDLPGIAPWWPHTHGEPALHAVSLSLGDRRLDLGRVGFRRIAVDRGPDGRGFALTVNDVPVFCRGAVWMPPDVVALPDGREAIAPALRRARDGGLNMLRVSGTTLPPPQAFHDLCDELGILVWQDLMMANFDYPHADAAFAASLAEEVRQLLDRLQASPSLAILCGGSEVAQQAAMMGLPPAAWSNAFLDETVPALLRALRPDLAFVPSSPHGGDLPFMTEGGPTHYFGVGAYRRPLEDARRAGVRFASECLAFANVPEPAALRAADAPSALHGPAWKAGVPRDGGASWDFEDVREHYLQHLYGVDPPRLRTEDPERYLDLSRAVVAEVMEATLAEWRRPGSPTAGALVWTLQDLRPGAGWGLLDAAGRPKSAWWGFTRAARPIRLSITDEGVNGLGLHAVNDTAEPLDATLTLTCLRGGRLPVATGDIALTVPARSGATVSSARVLGRFFDAGYAYRFGPADHDCCHAVLTGSQDRRILGHATWWLPGRRIERHTLGLRAALERDATGWLLRLATDRMAAAVAIDDDGFVPEDAYFDLAPGLERIVRLQPFGAGAGEPSGTVRAINGMDRMRYGAG